MLISSLGLALNDANMNGKEFVGPVAEAEAETRVDQRCGGSERGRARPESIARALSCDTCVPLHDR